MLTETLGIRRHEVRLVAQLFVFYLAIGMFYTVGATVGDTLFLSSLRPADVPALLPWVYVGIAVASVLAMVAYDALQARVSRIASLIGTLVVLALTVFGGRALIETGTQWVCFILMVWMEVCALLSIALFFSFAGDYFAPRDARRLYGVIGGGMALGTVLSGCAIQGLVPLIGTRNLLHVAAGLLLLSAAMALVIHRSHRRVQRDADEAEARPARVPLAGIFARTYVKLLAGVIPLALVATVAVDFQMKWIASAKPEAELAQFFGIFYGGVGLSQLVFQFLVMPRLLRRAGIVGSLMVMPITVGLASALVFGGAAFGYLGLGVLTFSAGANFLRMTLSETLDLPSRELLGMPLPTRIRERVGPLMSGALVPAAQGLGGLLLLGALALGLDVRTLSLLAVAATALLVLTLVRLRREYRSTLAATLREHQLDPTDLEQVISSPDAEALFAYLLRSDDPEVARSALVLLGDRPLGALGPVLEELIGSDDPTVAVAALERLGQQRDLERVDAMLQAWTAPDPQVREAAMIALCATLGKEARRVVAPNLDTLDLELRRAAMVGMARHGGSSGTRIVRPELESGARSDIAFQRAETARLLGRIGSVEHADLLGPLLRDEDFSVRREAAEACASIGDPELVPGLLEASGEPELRPSIMRALAMTPRDAVQPLIGVLTGTGYPLAGRCATAQVLSRVGGRDAVAALWGVTGPEQELPLRLVAVEALRVIRLQAVSALPEPEDYDARIEQLCDQIVLLSDARDEIATTCALAVRIYGDHAHLLVELLLLVLGLRFDVEAIDRVRCDLLSGASEAAGNALELMDEVVPRRTATRVIPALQIWLGTDRAQGSELSEATIERLLSAEPWLKVTTVHHLNQGAAEPIVEGGCLNFRDHEIYQLLDIVAFLKDVPLFADLRTDYLREEAEITDWMSLSQGDTLFDEGDEGDAVYLVADGQLTVVLKEIEVATLGRGECIGELALVDGQPRAASVMAETDARLLRLPSDRFQGLLVTQAPIARAVLRALDRRIRAAQADRREPAPAPAVRPRRAPPSRTQPLGLQQLVSTMSSLGQIELFQNLSPPALSTLAGIAREVLVYPGDVVFEQGDAGDSLYLICSGTIAIRAGDRELTKVWRGGCLGELALISGLPRSATATAVTEGRLLRIGAEDFDSLLSTEPEISLVLLEALAGRLRTQTRVSLFPPRSAPAD